MSAIVAHETSCNCRKCQLYNEVMGLHNKKTLSDEIETKSEQYFKSL
jgi:hypothetical protein